MMARSYWIIGRYRGADKPVRTAVRRFPGIPLPARDGGVPGYLLVRLTFRVEFLPMR